LFHLSLDTTWNAVHAVTRHFLSISDTCFNTLQILKSALFD
jgi:hypothetical protein